MKIAVIGATGTIGQAIVSELSSRHELFSIGHSSGDIQVDITNQESIHQMYQQLGQVDAIVSVTGAVHFGTLKDMTADEYNIGLQHKLMGQVNVVLAGLKHLSDHGSFTLTSGILNRDPIPQGSSAAMVNGAIDGFVRGAAIEMPRGLRINAVSPTVISESMEKYAPFFRGYEPVSAAQAARAYSKSIEGLQTGQVFTVG